MLNCTFEYYYNKLDYGCNEIYGFMISQGKTHEYATTQERGLRSRNGCDAKDKQIKLHPFILGSCPCNYLHPQFNELMLIYDQFKQGNLWENGGLASQPNQIIEFINYIGFIQTQYQEKEREKHKRS